MYVRAGDKFVAIDRIHQVAIKPNGVMNIWLESSPDTLVLVVLEYETASKSPFFGEFYLDRTPYVDMRSWYESATRVSSGKCTCGPNEGCEACEACGWQYGYTHTNIHATTRSSDMYGNDEHEVEEAEAKAMSKTKVFTEAQKRECEPERMAYQINTFSKPTVKSTLKKNP